MRKRIINIIFMLICIPMAAHALSYEIVDDDSGVLYDEISVIYDELQTLFLSLDMALPYEELMQQVKDSGLYYKEYKSNSSHYFYVGLTEGVCKRLHADRGDRIHCSFAIRRDHEGKKFSIIESLVYETDTTSIIQLFSIDGYRSSYWGFNELGVHVAIKYNQYIPFNSLEHAMKYFLTR